MWVLLISVGELGSNKDKLISSVFIFGATGNSWPSDYGLATFYGNLSTCFEVF